MIRYRAILIAAGYPGGNDRDALKSDPPFRMAVGRLPESGKDLCSEPTISRLENLPGAIALKRMLAAMVELFRDSFDRVPRRILRDIDDTEAGCTAASNWRCGTLITTAGVAYRSISMRRH